MWEEGRGRGLLASRWRCLASSAACELWSRLTGQTAPNRRQCFKRTTLLWNKKHGDPPPPNQSPTCAAASTSLSSSAVLSRSSASAASAVAARRCSASSMRRSQSVSSPSWAAAGGVLVWGLLVGAAAAPPKHCECRSMCARCGESVGKRATPAMQHAATSAQTAVGAAVTQVAAHVYVALYTESQISPQTSARGRRQGRGRDDAEWSEARTRPPVAVSKVPRVQGTVTS
jgi:hypothetical protein